MEQIRKRKLQAVLQEIRLGYMDSIVDAIVNQPKKSYDDIAREHGVSRQFLLNTAKMRGVGRNPVSADAEVSND